MKDFSPGDGYKEVQHTADVAFDVFGQSLEALFFQAYRAMLAYVDIEIQSGSIKRGQMRINEIDHESLLVTFLEEILLKIEIGLCPEIEDIKIIQTDLKANYDIHKILSIQHEVKAVTFHQLSIAHVNGFRTRLVLDV